jgi:hypothetical protein
MLWVLFILPIAILARHPSPNSIAIVANGGCGPQYACKPATQCSVWYDELRTHSSKPCSDAQGFIGLCCPDVVHVKCKVKLFSQCLVLLVLYMFDF